jgi:hypothetical protein
MAQPGLIKYIVIVMLLLPYAFIHAGKISYPVNLIPDSLLKNANSVVRVSEISLDVENAGKAEYHVHRVITVLNRAAASALDIEIYYTKFKELTSFQAELYDKDGKLLSKNRKDDMIDLAAAGGFSLFSDLRLKRLQEKSDVFPVTIEINYTERLNGFLDYPGWMPQRPEQSVESSTYTLITPDKVTVKYHTANMKSEPVVEIEKNKGRIIYNWRLQNLKAILVPENSYSKTYFLPVISFTPDTFEVAGNRGSWKGWNAFGLTMYSMWKNRQTVPDDVAQKAHEIVKGAKTDREKAALIYAWLQHEFHYVSIQIGMGYWVPFDVATVHNARYGDCKALSNYMAALLNEVGVKASPALINAGSTEHAIDTAFPGNYFNHVILYAELADGPLWLECTSNSLPFGQLSTFTENRYALVFDKDGGRIIKTPGSDAMANTWSESAVITVDNDLAAVVSDTIGIVGEFRLQARPAMVANTHKDRNKYIFDNRKLGEPENYSVVDFADTLGKISFNLNGKSEKIYEFKAGKKVFFPTTIVKSWYKAVPIDSTQKADLLLDFPSDKTEQLIYKLPATDKATLPGNFVLDNAVVHFYRTCEKSADNSIIIKTGLIVKKHIVPSSEIMLLKESLQAVNKYLQQRLIMEMN